jgi:hypothetical protein
VNPALAFLAPASRPFPKPLTIMSNPFYQQVEAQLRAYKQKYYRNLLLKGILLAFAAVLSAFLVVNVLEYFGNFSSLLRATLFYSFLSLAGITLFFWVAVPILRLLELHRPLSNEEAANQIGRYFPEVGDKLLNVLQLGTLSAAQTDLITASIEQKAQQLSVVKFTDAVNYQGNRRYLRYALPPFLILLVLFMFVPQLFTESTPRLVNYAKTFAPKAPFVFRLANQDLKVFKNEDLEIKLATQGSAVPSEAYLLLGDRRLKMDAKGGGEFVHSFKKIQKGFSFEFEASGFQSASYDVQVVERPNLSNFTAYLSYPAYLRKAEEKLINTGNLIVPQGTVVRWVFNTQQTEGVSLNFKSGKESLAAVGKGNNTFEFVKRAAASESYSVVLKNQFSTNKEAIEYFLSVIPDEYPTISLQQERDTALYNYLALGGNIADDYGISRLEFRYRVLRPGDAAAEGQGYKSVDLGHNPNVISQSYFHQVDLGQLDIKQGDRLEYYVQVWDNDGINGSKSSKTATQEFKLPDAREFAKEMESAAANTSNQMEGALKKAQELQKNLDEVQERLKGKKKLNWQDRQAIEELLKKKEELMKDIGQMQRQNQMLNERQERFGDRDQKVAEKAQQLQQLMDQVMDEETKRLYDELQKLLQQEFQNQNIQNTLEDIEKKQENIEKELDRALEMFKKLQFDEKLKETAKQLEQMSQEQKELAEETKQLAEKNLKEDKDNKADKKAKPEDQQKADKKAEEQASKEEKDAKDQKEAKDTDKKLNDSKDGKEQKDAKENKDAKEQKDAKKSEDGKQPEQKSGEPKPDQKQKPEQAQPESLEQLQEKQEELNQDFKELQEQMEQLEQMNQKLDKPQEMDKEQLEQLQKEIEQQQQQSQQQLQQKQPEKASQSQRKAAQKMQQMAQQMQQMQQSMEQQQQVEDYNDLRQILENLVKLSFDQENLMVQFRGIRQEDPRFVDLSQQQLKLKDNAKVIEDSLFALAKRVFQIQSFVTREVATMNDAMAQSLDELKKRNIPVAAGKQQLTMTSINNLALMLDETLHQMQQNMGQQMGGLQIVNKKRKPGEQMGEMQKSLNQQMQDLMKSGKSGRELSEELAKLAAQQQLIRKALKNATGGKQLKPGQKEGQNDGGNKGDGGDIGKLLDEMEKTEEDLVNKRLTQETVKRQKEILTRLLESEKALREREQDEKREAEQAKEQEKRRPADFSDYLKTKEKQIELLKSIPASLNPYYKKEVNEYFKKINE